MTPFRWALLALVVLTGAAALLFMPRKPDEPAAPQPVAVQALPLNMPAPAPQVSAPQAVGLPVTSATPAAARPAASAPPRVGSEGYGPHIERALAGNDAAAAWEAVRWLRDCATNEVSRNSSEQLRTQGIAPEFMTQRMLELDAEARRCQTVTAQHRAALPELASRAMRAGVPEAASAYAAAVFAGDLSPEQRREVTEGMRRDANAGNEASLLGAIVSHEAWGLSDTERLAYLYAYAELPGQSGNKPMVEALVKQGAVPIKKPPTPEQMAAAKLAGQQILDRVRAGKQP